MRRAAFILLVLAGAGLAEPRLFFSKDFPGSTPAYVAITLSRDGACQYRESKDDDFPVKMQLQKADAEAMFALADKLDRFGHPLESPLKVAKMGMKTFRFEEGDRKTETSFNFSEDPDARILADWFEKISETSQYYLQLERTVKYDKLGVNRSLLQLEIGLTRGRVVAGPIFLHLLDRVAKNDTYLNMARSRAANLAEAIRQVSK
ncbi:MAG: hypothetical protein ACKV22_23290 [Bryobacteraceae bacterium]